MKKQRITLSHTKGRGESAWIRAAFLLLMLVAAVPGWGQQANNKPISMELKDELLGNALKQFSNASGYRVNFPSEDVGAYRVTVSIRQIEPLKALGMILERKPFEYEVNGNFITIRKVKEGTTGTLRIVRNVEGRVVDANGDPLPGANIRGKDSSFGSISNADGYFTCKVLGDTQTLEASFVGMQTEVVSVRGRNHVNVIMHEDKQQLSDVVVTGYQRISRERSTASFGFVDSEQLNRQMHTDLASSLEGMVAGLQMNINPMSLDDARFCVLRYLPSESENAYGPRIVDPRSGEIIESHICWYHNVMNLLKKWYMVQCGPLDKRAQKMTFDDELMGSLIRFVSSHEVGHTLGLRHNMAASSATPVEKLRDKAWVEANGHTVSIMDYARFNYVAQPEDRISPKGLFPRIGDYDKWVIKWGYQYRPEFKDAYKEKDVLRTEVTKKLRADKRMWFVGDEGKGSDPRSQSEDLGDNNMKANEYGMKNLQRVMENILVWTAQPDNKYDDLKTIYNSVRTQHLKYTLQVQKNIGGRYTNNLPGSKPHDYIPRSLQKEAVEWLGRNLFVAPLWLYPEKVVSRLGLKPVDEISDRQSSLVALLLAPGMLHNVYSSSLIATEPYPLDEYLNDVCTAIWKPLNDSNELENNFRRQLHRTYLGFVERVLNPGEKEKQIVNLNVSRSDILLFMEMHLNEVEESVKKELAACEAGSLNYRHYKALLRTIDKTKEKYYGENGNASASVN